MAKKTEEFDVKQTAKFENDVVFYMKKKKYTHIIDDVKTVKIELEQGNFIGDKVLSNKEIVGLIAKYCL